MFGLIPREESFFELFELAAANAHTMAGELVSFLDRLGDAPPAEAEETARRIKDLEHVGDQITHETIERLNRTFITPMDRQDIHELICRLDDVADLIDTAVHRMVLYRVARATPEAKEMAACLRHATAAIHETMPLLRNMKNAASIRSAVIAIHTQENAADQALSLGLAKLFLDGVDAREILKWKDVYQEIESATDRCEDVANVLDSIVMKNA